MTISAVQSVGGGVVPILQPKQGTAIQNVSFTVTAGNSTAFVEGDEVIRIVADQDCRYNIGTGVTATADDVLLPSGTIEWKRVAAGQRISVIQVSAAGSLNVVVED